MLSEFSASHTYFVQRNDIVFFKVQLNLCKRLFDANWNFLESVGVFNNRRRSYFLMSIPIAMWFSALYKLCTVFRSFEELITYMFIFCGLTMVTVRFCIFMFKSEKFSELFSDIENWNMEFRLENDATTQKKLQNFTRKSARFSKYLFRIMCAITFYSLISSVFTNKFIVEVRLPGLDLYASPYYYIVKALQALWLGPLGLLTFSAYISVMFISVYFGIFLMKDIQQKLENMQEMDELKALECIKTCIRRHALIIKFHRDLEGLFAFGNFLEVSFFCIIPSIIIFYSTREYDLAAMIRDMQFVAILSTTTFTTFWVANNFCLEGLEISRAAYNSNWMDRGTEFRHYIILLIAASQKPLELTAGGLKPLNMQFFMKIIRLTYSFFTILKGSMNTN